ncbi:hypothetical protein IMG5_099510 [Ichthyophthirius multifiliis]|uniref:Transmembrane protein n=1 Tax=Ichthyophthirius multifiliis TaxID=5932 RepID=G0QS58_ICHMU|nr:hypothetical protein IMG5_099510 [Ichthyophthirius multifiliis]EGR31923.1 hypothetical protein IMG5_099510 [Ichthyophthirius multifiliis]|eukprot:XP_004035409.1 hypothetical protein IMG5_099510 [Ichthyophthirius multifiliis]
MDFDNCNYVINNAQQLIRLLLGQANTDNSCNENGCIEQNDLSFYTVQAFNKNYPSYDQLDPFVENGQKILYYQVLPIKIKLLEGIDINETVNQEPVQIKLVQKNIPKYFFGGKDIRYKFQNEVTDDDYDRSQGEVNVQPVIKEKTYQFSSLTSTLPFFKSKFFLSFISNNFDNIKAQSISDYFVPPKILDNSVFVYHAQKLGNTYRVFRGAEGIVLPIVALGFTYPLFSLFFAIPTYILCANAFIYEASRRLVIRMDILPHLEMVSIQRVGSFGILYSKLHRIQDLEYVPFESVEKEENYLWAIGGHGVDNHLIFRDKITNEFLYFDKTGVWDAKGLDHPLLN